MKDKLKELAGLLNDWENSPKDKSELVQKIMQSAEILIPNLSKPTIKKEFLHKYLNLTGRNDFLQALHEPQYLNRWAQTAFEFIRKSQYSLLDMFKNRVDSQPNHLLFRDMSSLANSSFRYRYIDEYTKEIAASFYSVVPENLRVAIFSENSIDSACCDLTCLFYDILDTPLNTHFNQEIILDIIKKMNINIFVVDSENRFNIIKKLNEVNKLNFKIFTTEQSIPVNNKNEFFLGEYCKRLNIKSIDKILNSRKRKSLEQVCTVMFTSGSTGLPKGVSFSGYNLITKRFARAAALPEVGNNEIFLCFLPLYHTFGRYLELLGSIYWGGTYVFSGNPSSDTLLSLFPKVNPTGFISIPLRWAQLYEKCFEEMGKIVDIEHQKITFRRIVGKNLRWGLSAAGYLDPKVFHFFERNSVNLCSGFGMTEATGGITMTPPGKYMENTTGIPLPGIMTKFTKPGELIISGHYIGRYLAKAGPDDIIPYPNKAGKNYWLPTGDIFHEVKDGYLEIIDRAKDIYKNNKGQTIAPRIVEKKFESVPGIKRTFLVGDGRAYNVILIVPDYSDPMLKERLELKDIREYFHQIVSSANQDLAPCERVINFTILNRDFQIEKGELTTKGSYNRKIIEQNFSDEVIELYKNSFIEIDRSGFQIRIPRWFFRDLSILEDEIIYQDNRLQNIRNKGSLPLIKGESEHNYIIGDFEYIVDNDIIDLGLFAHQPRLWIGNPSLIRFSPCKEGWDSALQAISTQIQIPINTYINYTEEDLPELKLINNKKIKEINITLSLALFADDNIALDNLNKLSIILDESDYKISETLSRRIEALSRHPNEKMRCLAYRILILSEPISGYSSLFPAFIFSGLTFLDNESIEILATAKLGRRRLEALRQRLYLYRTQLKWPGDDITGKQFERIFELLVNFAKNHPEFYASVRAELTSWILIKSDSSLSNIAEKYFIQLFSEYESRLTENTPDYGQREWRSKLVFEDSLSPSEVKQIEKVLIGTTFLKQSIILTCDEQNFDLKDVSINGIWVSKMHSTYPQQRFRISINGTKGKHFDIQMILDKNMNEVKARETNYWYAAISGYPFFPRVLPRMGCTRPELNARSMAYIGELTVWEKIRQHSEARESKESYLKAYEWRRLFIEAFAAFYRGWYYSGKQVIPGTISPNNVAVPERNFQEGATILSLADMKYYKNTISLILPIYVNFYQKTVAHYPFCIKHLKVSWIFDALIESLGENEAFTFMQMLKKDLSKKKKTQDIRHKTEDIRLKIRDKRYEIEDRSQKTEDNYFTIELELLKQLDDYLEKSSEKYYLPLSLLNAIDRYNEWLAMNKSATATAKEQTILEMYILFRLSRYPEIIRYYLYRFTYFSDSNPEIAHSFDNLLKSLARNKQTPAIQLLELSDLQSSIIDEDDRNIFSRMVFPRFQSSSHLDILKVGEGWQKHIIISSIITDKFGESYTIRQPINPAEIGQLYRLFYLEKFPKTVSISDNYLVIIDSQERIIGGICYKIQEDNIILLDGTVITSPLTGRGIGTATINDFCSRMTGLGAEVVQTHFLLRKFYLNLGFKIDNKWGALVRFLK